MPDKELPETKAKYNAGLIFSFVFLIQATLFVFVAIFTIPSQPTLFTILVAVTFALIFGTCVAFFATMAELLIFLIFFSAVKKGAG